MHLNGLLRISAVEELIKTLRDSSDFQYQKRLLHFRAIRSDMSISDPPPGHLRYNRLLSSAQALQMTGIESLEQGSLEDGKLMLKEASEIYEHLASLEEYSAEIKLELLLLAAITASLSDYQANAFVLSNNLPQSLNELTQNLRDNYSAFSILAILLLRRQIGAAKDFISEEMDSLPIREQSLIDRMQTQDNEYPTSDPIIDGWRFLCLKYYLQACNQFIRYLEFGENDAFEEATRLLNRVLEIFLTEGDVEYWYIVHAVRALTIRIRERSIWTNLYTKLSTPLVHQYCSNLVSATQHSRNNGSLFELWPSQITAIDKGLLDVSTDNLIIRLPTSAGKTRIAEMAILSSLVHYPNHLCIYVAPYRALVEDVLTSFRANFTALGFRVASILGGTEYVEDEEQLSQIVDILIVTPEKLDLILRRWSDILARTGIVIYDEGHIIAEETRGLRSEFLLSRILRQSQRNNFRVAFMSAMIPNLEDLQAFLHTDAEHVISSDWRPNRQSIGQFHWYDSQNRKNSQGDYGRVVYFTDDKIFIPRVIVRKEYPDPTQEGYQLDFFDSNKEQKLIRYPNSPSDTQAALALRYEHLGPVLIFSATKRKARSVCESLAHGLDLTKNSLIDSDEQRHALDILGAEIYRYLGNHELVRYIRQGFALHHSDFPESVRLLIEDGFRRRFLRILVATSTLAQGVNLPIKTVIVGSIRRGLEEFVPMRDYKNIIGRAGRANYETEGNIILCYEEKLHNHIAQRYSNLSPIVEDVTSRLWYLWESLIEDRLDVKIKQPIELGNYPLIPIVPTDGDEPHPIDTELFTILTEEVFDADNEDALFSVLSNTLFAHQCRSLKVDYRPLVAYLSARHRIVKEKYLEPGLQTTYYQTGLSLKSCNKIVQIIKNENPSCIEKLFSGEIDNHIIVDLADIAIRSQAVDIKQKDASLILKVLPYWLKGLAVSEIVENIGTELSGASAEKVCKIVYKYISKDLSWVVSGTIHLASGLLVTLKPELIEAADLYSIQLIPAFLKYGVNTKPAVWACLLGIEDRLSAIYLGQAYIEKKATLRFDFFSNWLLNLNFPELLQIVKNRERVLNILTKELNPLMQDIEQREFLQAGPKKISIDAHVWRNPGFTGVDREIMVNHDNNNPDPFNMAVFTNDNSLVGYIARNVSTWLNQLPSNLIISGATIDYDEDVVTINLKRLE